MRVQVSLFINTAHGPATRHSSRRVRVLGRATLPVCCRRRLFIIIIITLRVRFRMRQTSDIEMTEKKNQSFSLPPKVHKKAYTKSKHHMNIIIIILSMARFQFKRSLEVDVLLYVRPPHCSPNLKISDSYSELLEE